MAQPLIFVMSPYTHPCEDVMNMRAHLTANVLGKLMTKPEFDQTTLFSPVVHYHQVAIRNNQLPRHAEFWWYTNLPYMEVASKGLILTLPYWMRSKGVESEVSWFLSQGKPVEIYDLKKETIKPWNCSKYTLRK